GLRAGRRSTDLSPRLRLVAVPVAAVAQLGAVRAGDRAEGARLVAEAVQDAVPVHIWQVGVPLVVEPGVGGTHSAVGAALADELDRRHLSSCAVGVGPGGLRRRPGPWRVAVPGGGGPGGPTGRSVL